MPNNELQELLGARFERYEHPTDESVWTAIEAHLDDESSDKAGIWFWIFNGTAIALFAGILVSSAFSRVKSDQLITAGVLSEQSTKSDLPSKADADSGDQTLDMNHETLETIESEDAKGTAILENSNGISSRTDNGVSSKREQQNTPSHATAHPPIQTEIPSRSHTNASMLVNILDQSDENISLLELRAPEPIDQPHPSTCATTTLTSKKKMPLKPIPVFVDLQSSYLHRLKPSENPSVNPSDKSTIYSQLATNRRFTHQLMFHAQPLPRLTAGIGFGYAQTTHNYDYQSVSNQGVQKTYIRAKQTMYILPIQAKFNLYQRKRLQLHLGLSWVNEFGKTDYLISSQQDTWLSTSTPTESLQMSSNNNNSFHQSALEPFAHVSYTFSPRFSAHLDAGYRRYFRATQFGTSEMQRLQYTTATLGIMYQLR